MDTNEAQLIVNKLRSLNQGKRRWVNPRHIATATLRKGVSKKLSRDDCPDLVGKKQLSLVEIFLTEDLPDLEKFEGIFNVDELGIWYYDGDGHIDDAVWRERVIPWRFVGGLVLHADS